MNITGEILLKNAFKETYNIIDDLEYKIRVPMKGNEDYLFTITLDNLYSNHPNRKWNIQIDDDRIYRLSEYMVFPTKEGLLKSLQDENNKV